jgi:predicted PurR-regulated permease PerM/CheY-like chemotaxis protein
MPVTSNMTRTFMILVSSAVVLGLLSWLQAVLVPIALAILLTFMLSPVVSLMQERRIPRALAVLIVVGVAFSLIVGVGWALGRQVTSLVDNFPQYEKNLNAKLAAFHPIEGGFVDKLQRITGRVTRQLERQTASRTPAPQSGSGAPLPVKIVENGSPFEFSVLWSALGPVVNPIATIGLAIVLLIFMLMRREDLRDRVISVLGRGHLTLTTKALDEAGERISRYLLMQLIVNGSYGVALAGGLFAIGVPYALLWGFFAAVFRYIPYLGPWLAAILPLGLSLLVSPGWSAPLMVLGLFIALELVSNMLIEPWLYGRGIGLSETATLIMIAFWTWLWGPIGLVLATPLAVCLVVLGKYVPFLNVLDTLMGDKPALEPHVVFYQRLLARDHDEAAEIAETQLENASLVNTYDALLIPALTNARRDAERDTLSDAEHRSVVHAAREVAEQLATLSNRRERESAVNGSDEATASARRKIRILGIPARAESDRVALSMLEEVLDSAHYDLTIVNHGLLASDAISLVLDQQPAAVCIAALPPGGSAQARLLCLRLRARFPDLKILIGRWGYVGDAQKTRTQLLAAGASDVAATLEETSDQIASLRALTSPAPAVKDERLEDVSTLASPLVT